MTNRELMINLLMDGLGEFTRVHTDDGGSSEEAIVYYNINCPYYGTDPRGLCHNYPSREMCTECKYKWLDSEVDS